MNILQKLITVFLFIAVFSLYSCESCLECTIEYTDAKLNKDTSIVRIQCSKKKDREEFENDTKEIASDLDGTFKCIIIEN